MSPKMSQSWQTSSPWWRNAVIYQIYPRSFRDSNGDGIGDLPGVLAGLPHVASLGVDAIWLSPFYRSPMRDFGYDVSDHTRVDPDYGCCEDIARIIDAAHDLGLKVIFDLVVGHTSNRHAWFQESRANPAGDKGDWYVWADPKRDGMPPNNWLSVFGGVAWAWDPLRRQFYLHHFLREQPSLNLRNPAVRDAIAEVAEFWLQREVDGLRLDAVDFLGHHPELPDNPALLRPDEAAPAKLFGAQRHLHDMLHPEGDEVLSCLRDVADRYGAPLLGEVSSQPGAFERIANLTAQSGPLHCAYTLAPLRRAFDHDLAQGVLRQAERDAGFCWSTGNHDVVRFATRCAGAAARPDFRALSMRAAFLACLGGPLCIYQGDELGLPEAALAEEDLRDPFGLHYWPEFAGRDGCRTPLPWRALEPNAGFGAGKPWLPLGEGHRELAIDVQEDDCESVLNMWRDLLAWRRRPEILHGRIEPIEAPAPALAFRRVWRDRTLICVFNFSESEIEVALPHESPRGLRRADALRGDHATLTPRGVRLNANGHLVLALEGAKAGVA